MGFDSFEVQPYPPQVVSGVVGWKLIAEWFTWKMDQLIQHQFDVKDHMAKPVLDVDETNEKNENSKKKRKEWRWCWCEDLNVKTLAMLTISRWFSSIFASPSGEGGFRWKPDFSSLAKCFSMFLVFQQDFQRQIQDLLQQNKDICAEEVLLKHDDLHHLSKIQETSPGTDNLII